MTGVLHTARISFGKPNVAIFNTAIFIQFNPYSFNLIFIFIQFNPRLFNSIAIVILFNPYSFNSIFRSIQFNFCILLIQFQYWFNLISVYSFNSISIFIQFNFHIHSIQSVFIHSMFALIDSIWGSGSRGKLGLIVKMADEDS